jgi:hypothetical protein
MRSRASPLQTDLPSTHRRGSMSCRGYNPAVQCTSTPGTFAQKKEEEEEEEEV